jgi:hypothetical protein
VSEVVASLEDSWTAEDYHVFDKNCVVRYHRDPLTSTAWRGARGGWAHALPGLGEAWPAACLNGATEHVGAAPSAAHLSGGSVW